MEKQPILGLRQEKYKMNLEHFEVPESRKVFLKNHAKSHINGGMSKGHRSRVKELPMAKDETI